MYFKTHSEEFNSLSIKKLIHEFDYEGYGIFTALKSILAVNSILGYLDREDEFLADLSLLLNTPIPGKDLIIKIIKFCTVQDLLFIDENGLLRNDDIEESKEALSHKSGWATKQGKKGGRLKVNRILNLKQGPAAISKLPTPAVGSLDNENISQAIAASEKPIDQILINDTKIAEASEYLNQINFTYKGLKIDLKAAYQFISNDFNGSEDRFFQAINDTKFSISEKKAGVFGNIVKAAKAGGYNPIMEIITPAVHNQICNNKNILRPICKAFKISSDMSLNIIKSELINKLDNLLITHNHDYIKKLDNAYIALLHRYKSPFDNSELSEEKKRAIQSQSEELVESQAKELEIMINQCFDHVSVEEFLFIIKEIETDFADDLKFKIKSNNLGNRSIKMFSRYVKIYQKKENLIKIEN